MLRRLPGSRCWCIYRQVCALPCQAACSAPPLQQGARRLWGYHRYRISLAIGAMLRPTGKWLVCLVCQRVRQPCTVSGVPRGPLPTAVRDSSSVVRASFGA